MTRTEREAMKGLIDALRRFESYGDIFLYHRNDERGSPYAQAVAARKRAEKLIPEAA